MVGDVKQSIYRFRQAMPEILWKSWTVTTLRRKELSCKNHAGEKLPQPAGSDGICQFCLPAADEPEDGGNGLRVGTGTDPRRALSADGRHADGAAPDRCCKFTGKHRAAGGRLCGTPGRPVDNRRRQRVGKRRLPAGSVWGYLHPLTLSEEQSPGLSRKLFERGN